MSQGKQSAEDHKTQALADRGRVAAAAPLPATRWETSSFARSGTTASHPGPTVTAGRSGGHSARLSRTSTAYSSRRG